MSNKPYFSQDVVDSIVSVVMSEVEAEGFAVNEPDIRAYVVAPKTNNENMILQGVADGIYLATIKESEFAYKVKPPTDAEIDDILQTAQEKAEAAKAKGEWQETVWPPVKKEKHAARIGAQRAEKDRERKAAFERSKEVPTTEQVKETINMERAARLSHALNWIHKSPKLNTVAVPKENHEQAIALPV